MILIVVELCVMCCGSMRKKNQDLTPHQYCTRFVFCFKRIDDDGLRSFEHKALCF